ncbi:MAG TPA: sensor domain-containing diguanylate cyclase [bacterium]|nr:sensor domain-containing diguanylate cyclase [bacterium]
MPHAILRRTKHGTHRRSGLPGASASGGLDKRVAFLAAFASKSTAILGLQALLQYALRALRDDVGFDACSVALVDENDPNAFVIRAASGLCARSRGRAIPRGKGVHGSVAGARQPLLVSDLAADRRVCWRDTGARSAIYAPLVTRGRVTGILSAVRRQTAAFDEADLDVLVAVAGYVAAALEAARLHEQLREQAATDGLTGLANRRTLRRALERELARSRRSGHPVSVVFVEIDAFKKINDQFGHLHGDEVLRAVAAVLRGSCREMDLAARFGGDEFVLLLPEAGKRNAALVAERVRQAMTDIENQLTRVTASFGVATCSNSGVAADALADALLEAADRAMYQAKRAGGNRVVMD